MSAVKIIAIGDNVCDKYLSRGKMYPGGQCVNTCAYAAANGVPSAYLGKFGSDEVAAYNQASFLPDKVRLQPEDPARAGHRHQPLPPF